MTIEKIKMMLDACYEAKRIRELLPSLPKGVASSYIQYLDKIEQLEKGGVRVRISDISVALKIPCPGVTRTVKEMEERGYLRKEASQEDGRITYISMTEAGRLLLQTYNDRFFEALAPLLEDISDEEAACAISAVHKIYDVMTERRISLELG